MNAELSLLATAHPVWSPDAPSPAPGPCVLGLGLCVFAGRPVVGKAGVRAGAGGMADAGAVPGGWLEHGLSWGGGQQWATLKLSSVETQPSQASMGLWVDTEKP